MRDRIVAGLLLGTLAAWCVAITRMRGMDEGPGTDLGGLTSFLGIWLTMMVAMMLPSVAPMVLTFARIHAQRTVQGRPDTTPTWVFVSGYFAVWTAYGLGAYGVFLLARAWGPPFLDWAGNGRYLAGGAVAAAGAYQLTPAKEVCLRHCRSPLHFVAHGWREGWIGAFRLGVVHGSYCVGCCFGLFVILFAVGVMSLFWMAVIATVIFIEKALPFGERAARVFALAFILLGLLIAFEPSAVPGLTEPGSMP
jgi:predicted metal-binding membrane protein